MNDVVIVHKTTLLYPQRKGKLVVFGRVGVQTQFPQKTLHFYNISLHITSSFHWFREFKRFSSSLGLCSILLALEIPVLAVLKAMEHPLLPH